MKLSLCDDCWSWQESLSSYHWTLALNRWTTAKWVVFASFMTSAQQHCVRSNWLSRFHKTPMRFH